MRLVSVVVESQVSWYSSSIENQRVPEESISG